MRFDVSSLEDLRLRHVGWRLLRYERAPLAIAFLHHAFVASNARSLSEDDAIELLEDVLHSFADRAEHTDSISYTDDTDDTDDTEAACFLTLLNAVSNRVDPTLFGTAISPICG